MLAAHQAVLANYAHEVAQSKIITTTLLLIPFCSCLPNKLIFAVAHRKRGREREKKTELGAIRLRFVLPKWARRKDYKKLTFTPYEQKSNPLPHTRILRKSTCKSSRFISVLYCNPVCPIERSEKRNWGLSITFDTPRRKREERMYF